MSRFAKELQIGSFDKRKIELTPLERMLSVQESVREIDFTYEYRVSAMFQLKFVASEEAEVRQLLLKVRRQMVHALFGEFLEPIHRIREALWKRDFQTAQQLLDELETEMFST